MEQRYTKKNKGNAGLEGVQFQLDLLIVFLLNALRNLKNWRISSENEQAGKFDDLVLELSDKRVLLQAKFKQNKKITKDQVFSCNTKGADFSLPKYFFSYLEIRSASIESSVIICTNTNIDEKYLEEFTTCHNASLDNMLHYEGDTCSFFTLNDNVLAELKASAEIYLEKNLQNTRFDKSVITDENIKDFLKHLQFFTNYPSGNKLDKIIDQLLSCLNKSSLYRKVSTQEIYKKIEEWFKQPKAEYVTEERAKAMFSEIKSDKFCEELKHYNVSFRCNKLNFTDSKRMYLITSKEGQLLQTLKIYDALQKYEHKKLYVSPNDAVEVKQQIIEAFAFSCYRFLVIIGFKITQEIEAKELIKLKDILTKYSYKKVILVTDSNDELNQQIGLDDIAHINEPVTFKDLSDACQQRLINENNIIFQGDQISLDELLTTQTEEDLARAINFEILEKLIRNDEIKVGASCAGADECISPYYIHRSFKRRIVRSEFEYGASDFKEETSLQKITVLNLDKNCSSKTVEDIFTEETMFDVNEDAILIADTAGMGKSTVFAKLATCIKNKNPHLWVIKIEISDYSDMFKNLLENGVESVSITEILNSKISTKLSNHLEKFVFSMNKKVVLMIDGIDEISPDYTQLVFECLIQCQEAANFAKLFVTTRPHLVSKLENILKVKSIMLQAFTEQDKVDFLTSYWAHNLDAGNNKGKCEQFAKEIISRLPSLTKTNDFNDFTAIPLQLKMLAEIFEDNTISNSLLDCAGCNEYLKEGSGPPKLPERIDINKLYDMFVDKKRDIYISKENPNGKQGAKKALMEQFDESLTYHRSLALEIFLSEENCLHFSCYRQSCKDINECVLKIGIMQKSNGKFNFIHRTFAEYFAAESIFSELQLQLHSPNIKFQEVLINNILHFKGFETIRIFLDNFLSTVVNSIPSSIFDKYRYHTLNPLSYIGYKQYFMGEANLIHLLSSEGCVAILQLILKCVNFKIIRDKEMNMADINENFVRNTLLAVAQKIGTDSYLKKKLNALTALHIIVKNCGINIRDKEGLSSLRIAAHHGHLEMMKFLAKQGAKMDSQCKKGTTPLHVASFFGHTDIVKFLVQWYTDVNIENPEGVTPLHLAITEGYPTIVECLLKCSGDVNIQDKTGLTALHYAVTENTLAVIECVVKANVDVNIKNYYGQTALHFAVAEGNFDTVKLLLEHGADFNIKNNDGYTPSQLALCMGYTQIADYLETIRTGCTDFP